MSNVSEKKKPSHTSDVERNKDPEPIDGREGLERLADFTRRVLRVGKALKTKTQNTG